MLVPGCKVQFLDRPARPDGGAQAQGAGAMAAPQDAAPADIDDGIDF